MSGLTDNQIKIILQYDVDRPYFGMLTARKLAQAYGQIIVSRNHERPITSVPLLVGRIDGDVICGALWREMSYNPGRFGTVSPFVHNGKNDIYHFCRTDVANFQDEVLASVHGTLVDYMSLNANPINNAWRDELPVSANGYVRIEQENGHSNKTYKKLACLRDGIAAVARQNVKDFERKRGAFRAPIIDAVAKRHPDGVRPYLPITGRGAATPIVPSYVVAESRSIAAERERMEDALDRLQITLDSRDYIDSDVYDQAQAEYQAILQHMAALERR